MKITQFVLLFSILVLGACSTEESIAEETAPPALPIPPPDCFEEKLTEIMSDLRSIQKNLENTYSLISEKLFLIQLILQKYMEQKKGRVKYLIMSL